MCFRWVCIFMIHGVATYTGGFKIGLSNLLLSGQDLFCDLLLLSLSISFLLAFDTVVHNLGQPCAIC